jgi:hypothetical protein
VLVDQLAPRRGTQPVLRGGQCPHGTGSVAEPLVEVAQDQRRGPLIDLPLSGDDPGRPGLVERGWQPDDLVGRGHARHVALARGDDHQLPARRRPREQLLDGEHAVGQD